MGRAQHKKKTVKMTDVTQQQVWLLQHPRSTCLGCRTGGLEARKMGPPVETAIGDATFVDSRLVVSEVYSCPSGISTAWAIGTSVSYTSNGADEVDFWLSRIVMIVFCRVCLE